VEAPSDLKRGIGASNNYFFNCANQDSNTRPLALILY